MIAVVFDRHGGPDVMGLREMPDPEPGHGQVRVRVAGCGVNHLDLWVREGMPGVAPLPHIAGSEVSGTIDRLGPGVTRLREGQGVLVIPGRGCGTVRVLPCRPRDDLPFDSGSWATVGRGDTPSSSWSRRGTACRSTLTPVARGVGGGPARLPDRLAHALRPRGTPPRPGRPDRSGGLGGRDGRDPGRQAGRGPRRGHGGEGPPSAIGSPRWGSTWPSTAAPTTSGNASRSGRGGGASTWSSPTSAATRSPSRWPASARGGRLVTCGATAGPRVELDLRFVFTRELTLSGAYLGTRSDLDAVVRLVSQGQADPGGRSRLSPRRIPGGPPADGRPRPLRQARPDPLSSCVVRGAGDQEAGQVADGRDPPCVLARTTHRVRTYSSTRKTLWQAVQLALTAAWAFLACAWVTPSFARDLGELFGGLGHVVHQLGPRLVRLLLLLRRLLELAGFLGELDELLGALGHDVFCDFLNATAVRTPLVMARFLALTCSMILCSGESSSWAIAKPVASAVTAAIVNPRIVHFRSMILPPGGR